MAVMAIALKKRSTLVVAPTLDLVRQWHATLEEAFGVDVGMIGGGEYDLKDLTVTTYDSAYLHMDRLGNRFGLVVFDEVHHLPGESYALTAKMCIAPFRLGLTATLSVPMGVVAFRPTVGEEVYRKNITELSGTWLRIMRRSASLWISPKRSERSMMPADSATSPLCGLGHHDVVSSGFRDFIMRASHSEQGVGL